MAQSNPSKEYIRLGHRILAIEGPALPTVTITPSTSVVVASGGTQQFNATVVPSQPITWNVTCDSSPTCQAGTINASGLYTAPSVSAPATVEVYVSTASSGGAPISWVYVTVQPAVSPQTAAYASGGGEGTVAVYCAGSTSWSASTNVTWIQILNASGSCNSTITALNYTVAANSSSNTLSGQITVSVGGSTLGTVAVTESPNGSSISLSPTSAEALYPGYWGYFSVSTTPASGVNWTATSNSSWLTLVTTQPSGTTCTGAATVSGTSAGSAQKVYYCYAANSSTASTRSGTVSVGGQTFTLTQDAAVSLNPVSATLSSASAATGSFVVTAAADQYWSVGNTGSTWISITSPTGVASGTQTVSYSVPANTSTSPLNGSVTVTALSAASGSALATSTFSLTQPGASPPTTVCIDAVNFETGLYFGSSISFTSATWIPYVEFHAFLNSTYNTANSQCTGGTSADTLVTWPTLPNAPYNEGQFSSNGVYTLPTNWSTTLSFSASATYGTAVSNSISVTLEAPQMFTFWGPATATPGSPNVYGLIVQFPGPPAQPPDGGNGFYPLEVLFTASNPTTNSQAALNACDLQVFYLGNWGSQNNESEILLGSNSSYPPSCNTAPGPQCDLIAYGGTTIAESNLSNSQCTVSIQPMCLGGTLPDCYYPAIPYTASTVYQYQSDQFDETLSLIWNPSFGGYKNVWARICSGQSLTSGSNPTGCNPDWTQVGSIVVPGYQPPTVAVTGPSSASGNAVVVEGYAFDNLLEAELPIGSVSVDVDGNATGQAKYGTAQSYEPSPSPCPTAFTPPGCPSAIGFSYTWDSTTVKNGTHQLTAVATVTDPTGAQHTATSAQFAVSVQNSLSLTVTPNTTTLYAGQGVSIAASEGSKTNPSVTWNVSPACTCVTTSGSTASVTAPATINTSSTVTITATSTVDSTIVSPPVTITFQPISVTLGAPGGGPFGINSSVALSATVTPSGSPQGLSWSLSPSVGTLAQTTTANGSNTYYAPSQLSAQQIITVTATSTADTSKSGATSFTIYPVTVAVAPSSAILYASQTQQFTATVSYDSSNKGVTWSVPSGMGSIGSTTGLYQAPASIASQQNVSVVATSVADSTQTGSATVTLMPPVAVTVSPSNPTLINGSLPGGTQQFTASVTGDPTNSGVTWSVVSGLTTPGKVTSGGFYTAPNPIPGQTAQTENVVATSVKDPAVSGLATVVLDPVTIALSPAASEHFLSQTQQLVAALGNAGTSGTSTTVNWSITSTKPANIGKLAITSTTGASASNTYTAPAAVSVKQTDTVTATSQLDPTKSASATITIYPVVVSLSPATSTLYPSQTVTLQASLNTSNSAVTWSTPSIGTLVGSGLTMVYTAPQVTATQNVTVTVTSGLDPTKSATATIQILPSPVTVTSLSPSSGTTTSATFQSVFTDTLGAADINSVEMAVGASTNLPSSCYIQYLPAANTVSLAADSGTSWLTPVVLGTAGATMANSQCSINVGASSATSLNNTLTLNLALFFLPAYSGPQYNIYLYASDAVTNSGWQTMGTWTVPPVAPLSLTPNTGSLGNQTFVAVATDTTSAGASDIANVGFLVTMGSTAGPYKNDCYVLYSASKGSIYLRNDGATAWLGPLTPGQPGSESNSQCTLTSQGASVALNGNNLTFTVPLSFAPTFAGSATLAMAVQNAASSSGMVSMGTWTVPPVAAVSVSPASGTGSSQAFTATYVDDTNGNGASDLQYVTFLVSPSPTTTAHACYIHYTVATNTLYLRNNLDTTWQVGIQPGSGQTENSQCTLAGTGTSATIAGNTLTLTLALSFSSSYGGTQEVTLTAQTQEGAATGAYVAGTWTVP